jgi:cytochrome d ubiquinol oxidase subunit II
MLFVFFLCILGVGISIYPYVMPGAVTIYEAATDRSRQVFLRVGTDVVAPLILICTGWVYRVFCG